MAASRLLPRPLNRGFASLRLSTHRNLLSSQSHSSFTLTPSSSFSTTRLSRSGGGHDDHYDPPTGWLFGVKPGEKYKKEGWEGPFVYGFWGSIVLFTIAYCFKPDTSIQTWALEEARRRLEAEGILPDPDDEKSEE